MASTRISTILDELRVEEADIQQSLDRLRGQMKTAETQLAQIRKAQSSLKGKPQNTTAAKKPTATKEEVVDAITQVLQANGSATEEELKTLVEERLKSQSKSRTGFVMRFRNALKEPQFVRTGSNLSLAGNHEILETDLRQQQS
jgi:hypothetical protein